MFHKMCTRTHERIYSPDPWWGKGKTDRVDPKFIMRSVLPMKSPEINFDDNTGAVIDHSIGTVGIEDIQDWFRDWPPLREVCNDFETYRRKDRARPR